MNLKKLRRIEIIENDNREHPNQLTNTVGINPWFKEKVSRKSFENTLNGTIIKMQYTKTVA